MNFDIKSVELDDTFVAGVELLPPAEEDIITIELEHIFASAYIN